MRAGEINLRRVGGEHFYSSHEFDGFNTEFLD